MRGHVGSLPRDKKSHCVNQPFNNSIHFHIIYHSHPDNVLASCLAAMNHREKFLKMLGTLGMCYGWTNVLAGDSIESTLPWQGRLENVFCTSKFPH